MSTILIKAIAPTSNKAKSADLREATGSERCANCSMYGELRKGMGHCSALRCDVGTEDVCDLWEKREAIEKAVVLIKASTDLTRIEVLMKAHDYSSTQVNLPEDLCSRIADFSKSHIPDADLADKGRETDSHITIKYGINDSKPGPVEALVKGHKPVKAKLGNIALFKTNPEYDVVIIEVESKDAAELNKLITRSVPCTTTFPHYVAHCTIAYVKKGAGDWLDGGEEFAGTELTFPELVFSSKSDKATVIPFAKGKTILIKSVPGAIPPAIPNVSQQPPAIHAPAPAIHHEFGQSSEAHAAYKPAPLFHPHELTLPKPVQPTNNPDELWKQGKTADEALHEALNRKSGYSTHAKMPVVDAGNIPDKADNPIGHNTWHEHAKAAMQHPKGAVMFGPLKGKARATEKAEADQKPGEPLPYNSILDVSRATVMADKHQDLHEHLKQVRHHMAQHGFVLTRAKDKYQTPDNMGYRHALTNWMHKPTGHHVEVQFSDRDMQAAKDGPGHKHYEAGRQLEDKAKAEHRPLTEDEEKQFVHHASAQQNLYGNAWQTQLKKHEMSKAVRRMARMDHSKSIYGYYSYEGRPAVIHPRNPAMVWNGHAWAPHHDRVAFIHSADSISSSKFHELVKHHKATPPPKG